MHLVTMRGLGPAGEDVPHRRRLRLDGCTDLSPISIPTVKDPAVAKLIYPVNFRDRIRNHTGDRVCVSPCYAIRAVIRLNLRIFFLTSVFSYSRLGGNKATIKRHA